jgi:hypothetical protein
MWKYFFRNLFYVFIFLFTVGLIIGILSLAPVFLGGLYLCFIIFKTFQYSKIQYEEDKLKGRIAMDSGYMYVRMAFEEDKPIEIKKHDLEGFHEAIQIYHKKHGEDKDFYKYNSLYNEYKVKLFSEN